MADWLQTTIGEQATLQRGFDITRAAQRPGPVPVVSSGGVSSYHDEAAVQGPGVVLGRKGVVGSVFYIESDYWPHDTSLWVKNFHGNDRRFVYYFFRSIADQLARLDVGSANPTLNRNHVHPIAVSWPAAIDEQRAISRLLGSIDDKIELNQRMSKTLEAMAQAIFRDWFVDFGPVRRKLAGETDPVAIMGGLTPDPLYAAELTALFPAGMESADVPENWSVEPFGRFFKLERGLSYKGSGLSPLGKPLINLGCFSGAGGFNAGKLKFYVGDHKPRHTAEPGTLLIANTDITQDRVILGSPHIVDEARYDEQPLFSHHIYAARPLLRKAWERFFFYHLMEPAFRERAAGFATGTTVLALPKDAIEGAEFAVPPEAVLDSFLDIVRPLLDRAQTASSENRTLAETRDYMLPRLISGAVRVKEALEQEAAA